jgi:protease-4
MIRRIDRSFLLQIFFRAEYRAIWAGMILPAAAAARWPLMSRVSHNHRSDAARLSLMPESYPPPPPPPSYAEPARGVYDANSATYASPPRRSAWFWVAIIVAILAVVVLGVCFTVSRAIRNLDLSDSGGPSFGGSSIAVIDISGVILDADKVDKQLEKFGNDDNVKAILLHIDSPGGGAAASQEIYHEVLHIRQDDHKVVVASVESMGASGAYYIASACDKIYANPASVVGSIGVIMEWTNYGDLLKWAKMKNITISRGDLKDAGDPTRDLTPKEEAYFQSLVDNMYGQFIHDVAVGRHTTDDKIAPLATGQVWTGEQAQPLGLIDAQGGYRVALIDTARAVGIHGEPHVVRPARDKHGLIAMLNDDADDLFPNPSQLLNRSPGFYYLWK